MRACWPHRSRPAAGSPHECPQSVARAVVGGSSPEVVVVTWAGGLSPAIRSVAPVLAGRIARLARAGYSGGAGGEEPRRRSEARG